MSIIIMKIFTALSILGTSAGTIVGVSAASSPNTNSAISIKNVEQEKDLGSKEKIIPKKEEIKLKNELAEIKIKYAKLIKEKKKQDHVVNFLRDKLKTLVSDQIGKNKEIENFKSDSIYKNAKISRLEKELRFQKDRKNMRLNRIHDYYENLVKRLSKQIKELKKINISTKN